MLDEMRAEVARTKTIAGSVHALVNGMADKIEALSAMTGDAEVVKAEAKVLADELRAANDALQGDVTANTDIPDPSATDPSDPV